MEWPISEFCGDAIKISELIVQLQEILKQYGDLPVYCAIDYDWVVCTDYNAGDVFSNLPHVRLES